MSDQTPFPPGPSESNPTVDQAPIEASVAGTSSNSQPPKIVGYCRACGIALNEATVRVAQGSIFCAAHAPAHAFSASPSDPNPQSSTNVPPRSGFPDPRTGYSEPRYADSPYSSSAPPPQSGANPVGAFWLGLIPGVGAIYNGQYAKGMAHVVIFGLLVSLADHNGPLEPLFGMLIPAFVFYMAFEAYHTARNRRDGLPIDEFSSLVPGHTSGTERFPVAPLVLIVAGVVFLLDSLDIFQIQRLEKFWPVLLILLGAYLLYARTAGWSERGGSHSKPTPPSYTHTVPDSKPSAKREPSDTAAPERV